MYRFPAASTATSSGEIWASVAGPPSRSGAPWWMNAPATVEMIPSVSSLRTCPFSAMYRFPATSVAIPAGLANVVVVPGTLSRLAPATLPATIRSWPVVRSRARTTLVPLPSLM